VQEPSEPYISLTLISGIRIRYNLALSVGQERYPSTSRVPDRGGALSEGCDWFESEPPLVIRGKSAPGTVSGGGGSRPNM